MHESLVRLLASRLGGETRTVLAGEPGTGKSFTIGAACKQQGVTAVFIDACCKKSIRAIQATLAEASSGRLKRTCVIFDNFGSFVEDGLSISHLLDTLWAYKIPLVFEIEQRFESKLRKLCRSGDVVYIRMSDHAPTKAALFELAKRHAAQNGLKVTQKAIRALIKEHFPNIRKILISLSDDVCNAEDTLCTNSYDGLMHVLGTDSTDFALKTAQCDFFMMPALVHENYLDLAEKRDYAKIADAMSQADVFHTFMYQRQAWELSEVYCAIGVLYPGSYMRQPATADDIRHSSYMNKLSNISVRRGTLQRLGVALNRRSVEQLYVTMALAKKNRRAVPKINKSTMSSLQRFFES